MTDPSDSSRPPSGAPVADVVTLSLDAGSIGEAILASVPLGILVLDVTSKVLYANRELERIFGTPSADLMGRPLLFDRRHRRLIAVINEHRKSAPALDSSRKHEEELFVRPDGTSVRVGYTIARLVDHDRTVRGYVVVCEDLTELHVLRDRAKRAEALAALGTIAAGVAHEVRNPLHAIRGAAELIGMRVETDPVTQEWVGTIEREVQRADRIVEEVLDYSRPARLELQPVNVNKAVTHFLTLLEIPATVHLVQDLMPALPVVMADEWKLCQVVANLINNAKDAMHGQGTLHIATSLDPGPADTVTPAGVGYVRIDVADTGPGIPREALDHIFDPYYSGKRGGTGLGLSICLKIVEAHQGFIQVSSPPGNGALFSVFLPVPLEGGPPVVAPGP